MRSSWLPTGIVLLLFGVGVGCGSVHTARPIGKGAQQIHVSVGGPVLGVGEPSVLLPLPVLTYKYGFTDKLDVYGGWHVLETFANQGNLFVDLGASYYLDEQQGIWPGISVATTLSPLVNRESFWMSIDTQLTLSWMLDKNERHLLYTGAHHGLAPFNNGVVPVPLLTWAPYLGYEARLFNSKWMRLGAEAKWLRPYANTKEGVIGFLGPGDQGALSFLVSWSAVFGGAK